MQPTAASSTHLPIAIAVAPFEGTVTVWFSDAVIASSERAKVL